MTSTQLSYLGLVETKRNNVATLKESRRHSRATEKETKRNNIASLRETSKHNRATESQAINVLKEDKRANRAKEANQRQANANTISAAQISASGRVQSAQISAQASRDIAKFNNDTKLLMQQAELAMSEANNLRDNATKKGIAKLARENDVLLQNMRNMQNDKQLTATEKIELRKATNQLKIANQNLQKDYDNARLHEVNEAIKNALQVAGRLKESR